MPTRRAQETLYLQRINAVVGHVRENLAADLSLEALAQVAGFSPFHFHRLFKAVTGETLNALVLRLRLERAAHLLRGTPRLTLTQAALDCGFTSASVFSRAFKKHYGLTARSWDRHSPLKNSKIGQVLEGLPRYTLENLSDFAGRENFTVRLRTLPAQRLAYLRVYDAYNPASGVMAAYQRLLDWYGRQGGRLEKTTLYGMSQDDPDITPLRLCRFDWCLKVPADWRGQGEVDVIDFPACRVATVRLLGDVRQEALAFQYLFRYWLPRSRYQPANLPAMEIYRRQPAELGWETYDMDCAVPVVPL